MCSLCCCVKENFSKSGYCCVYHTGPSGSPPPPVDPVKTFRLVLAPVALPPPHHPPHTRPCVYRLVNDEGRKSQHCHAVCLAVDFPLALAVTEHGGAIMPGLLSQRKRRPPRLFVPSLHSLEAANCRQGEGCVGGSGLRGRGVAERREAWCGVAG